MLNWKECLTSADRCHGRRKVASWPRVQFLPAGSTASESTHRNLDVPDMLKPACDAEVKHLLVRTSWEIPSLSQVH
jgi:hypothetical protein